MSCKTLLEQLPVADIAIQDIAIEDVIRNIFSGPPGGEKPFHAPRAA